jgi:2-aminoadipate transaminase
MSAMELFDKAIKENVAFVPGKPFYVGSDSEENTLRLSYVTVDEVSILEGIKRLSRCMTQ